MNLKPFVVRRSKRREHHLRLDPGSGRFGRALIVLAAGAACASAGLVIAVSASARRRVRRARTSGMDAMAGASRIMAGTAGAIAATRPGLTGSGSGRARSSTCG